MAIKLCNTILLSIILPVFLYILNSSVFALLMICTVWFVCGKSLFTLFIYNFASDEMLYRYEEKVRPVSEGDIILRRILNLSLTVLFAVFFLFGGLSAFGAIKYAAYFAAALWVFDFIKTIYSYFNKDFSDEYTIKDIIFEALMWCQNIISLIIVFFLVIQ